MQINPKDKADIALTITEKARRRQIIEITIEIIAELGYHRASYARIMERAGLSSSRIITYHLGSKADLMQAVLLEIIDTKDRFLEERAGNPTSRKDIIRTHIEAEVAFLGEYPNHVRALHEIEMHSRSQGSTSLPRLLLQGVRVGRVTRQLQQGQQDGSFGEFDVEVMANSIVHAIEGADEALRENIDLDLEHYGHELANLFQKTLTA